MLALSRKMRLGLDPTFLDQPDQAFCWRQLLRSSFFLDPWESYVVRGRASFTCGWALCCMGAVLAGKNLQSGVWHGSSPSPTHTHIHTHICWSGEKFSTFDSYTQPLRILGQISFYPSHWGCRNWELGIRELAGIALMKRTFYLWGHKIFIKERAWLR